MAKKKITIKWNTDPDFDAPMHESGKEKLRVLYPKRTKRRYLPPLVRYLLIAFLGGLISIVVYYLLKEIGY